MKTNQIQAVNLKGKKLIYHEIVRYIDSLLTDSELEVGDKLLSEREIAEQFKTSNLPVRQAMQRFIEEGYLEKKRGSGTFVLRTKQKVSNASSSVCIIGFHHSHYLFASPYYSRVIAGIHLECERLNVQCTQQMMGFESLDDESLASHDGLIILDPRPENYDTIKQLATERKIPIVVTGTADNWNCVDSLALDNVSITTQLVQTLIDHGHKRIACFYPDYELNGKRVVSDGVRTRINTYKQVLKANGLEFKDEWLICPLSWEGESNASPLLQLSKEVTAVFSVTSTLVNRFILSYCGVLGLRVPDDLSVVAIDNAFDMEYANPPVTTSSLNLKSIGTMAARALYNRLQSVHDSSIPFTRTFLSSDVKMRQSVKDIT